MSPLFPPDGVPYYVREALPPEFLSLLSQPATADEAAAIVRANLAGDGDVVKLFTGSWVKEGGSAKPMPVDIATAAVEEAHRHGALVFTHPSDVRGLEVVLAAGVDVLAHSVEALDGFEPSHLQRMRERGMAMVPTLQLFSVNPEPKLDAILREVGDYQRLGGEIWFRSEEHTSELQSLMRISYAVFCLKKKKQTQRYIKKNDSNHLKHKKQKTTYKITNNIVNYKK